MNIKDYIESGILTQCLFEEASEEDTKKFFKAVKKYKEVRVAWEELQQNNIDICVGIAESDGPPYRPNRKELTMTAIGQYDLITKGYNPFTKEGNLELYERNKALDLDKNKDKIVVTIHWGWVLIGFLLLIIASGLVINHFIEQNTREKDVSKQYREEKKQLTP